MSNASLLLSLVSLSCSVGASCCTRADFAEYFSHVRDMCLEQNPLPTWYACARALESRGPSREECDEGGWKFGTVNMYVIHQCFLVEASSRLTL